MNNVICLLLPCLLALVGCSVESIVRKNDDRYLQQGSLDSPLSGIYSHYSFKLSGRYLVRYDWVNSSPCALRSTELPPIQGQYRSNIHRMPEIYEADGRTWQSSDFGLKPIDIDRWVGSVIQVSNSSAGDSQILEVGLKPLCQEGWATSSHFLLVRIRRSTLEEFQDQITAAASGVPIQWTRRTLNGLEWRVMQVPLDQLRPHSLNAIGGPYKTWITALGDTGYAIAFSLGASKESLDYPRAHAAFEATFHHLVNSLKVEPL